MAHFFIEPILEMLKLTVRIRAGAKAGSVPDKEQKHFSLSTHTHYRLSLLYGYQSLATIVATQVLYGLFVPCAWIFLLLHGVLNPSGRWSEMTVHFGRRKKQKRPTLIGAIRVLLYISICRVGTLGYACEKKFNALLRTKEYEILEDRKRPIRSDLFNR